MTEDEAADKVKDRMIEMHSRVYDRAAAYTNLIVIGGYAGAFAIWNFTRAQLTNRTTIAVAIFLGLSLTAFIFFEVYKMTINGRTIFKFNEVMKGDPGPIEFLRRYKVYEVEMSKRNIGFQKIWVGCLGFCVIMALIALAILFYNFFFLVLPAWA